MQSPRRGSRGQKRRIAGLCALACSAALVLSGCFQAVGGTYVVTSDSPGVLYTIKKSYSDAIEINWVWKCNVDLNGNGIPGGEQDRGWCALRLMRAVSCPYLGSLQGVCNAAMADREWDDFNPAMKDAYGLRGCIAVHINPFADNTYNWTSRSLGSGGCVN